MKILLDSHALLWSLSDPDKLSGERLDEIQNLSNTIYVSSVAIAELMIKHSLGKLEVHADLVKSSEEAGFEMLDFDAASALRLGKLPFHHRDPFDRMLICQGLESDIPIMTDDPQFPPYGCRII
jgi:PIN domain nuclease of toxin-antitoxin system